MPLCFAIMPITTPPEVSDRYGGDPRHFVKVAKYILGQPLRMLGSSLWPPAIMAAEVIQAEIIENPQSADLVLCDVTTWNANVFFELGIRVALNKPVAMVRDDVTSTIPFDNSIVNTHTYTSSLHVDIVEVQIPLLASFLKSAGTQDQNVLWKFSE